MTATTDWRALCAELLEHASVAQAVLVGEGLWDGDEDEGLIERAREALARPELADGPAVPESREPASVVDEPSDEDIMRMPSGEVEP